MALSHGISGTGLEYCGQFKVTVMESIIITVYKSFMGFEIRPRDLCALCRTVLYETYCATRVVRGCSSENWCGDLELHIYLFIYLLMIYFKTLSAPQATVS
jgi:hypothetical protein